MLVSGLCLPHFLPKQGFTRVETVLKASVGVEEVISEAALKDLLCVWKEQGEGWGMSCL